MRTSAFTPSAAVHSGHVRFGLDAVSVGANAPKGLVEREEARLFYVGGYASDAAVGNCCVRVRVAHCSHLVKARPRCSSVLCLSLIVRRSDLYCV